MSHLLSLPTFDDDGDLHVVVESPRGATVKLAHDPELDAFVFRRALVLGAAYPFDWGFVPSTRAEDGDPLDAMVIFEGSTYPGVVHKCRPIGVLQIAQNAKGKGTRARGRQRNDRILAVPTGVARLSQLKSIAKLEPRFRVEIEHFFQVSTAFENKDLKILAWGGPREARSAIARARAHL